MSYKSSIKHMLKHKMIVMFLPNPNQNWLQMLETHLLEFISSFFLTTESTLPLHVKLHGKRIQGMKEMKKTESSFWVLKYTHHWETFSLSLILSLQFQYPVLVLALNMFKQWRLKEEKIFLYFKLIVECINFSNV